MTTRSHARGPVAVDQSKCKDESTAAGVNEKACSPSSFAPRSSLTYSTHLSGPPCASEQRFVVCPRSRSPSPNPYHPSPPPTPNTSPPAGGTGERDSLALRVVWRTFAPYPCPAYIPCTKAPRSRTPSFLPTKLPPASRHPLRPRSMGAGKCPALLTPPNRVTRFDLLMAPSPPPPFPNPQTIARAHQKARHGPPCTASRLSDRLAAHLTLPLFTKLPAETRPTPTGHPRTSYFIP
ncbi:unnamed protein product [Gadus morhua 'NCC']